MAHCLLSVMFYNIHHMKHSLPFVNLLISLVQALLETFGTQLVLILGHFNAEMLRIISL